MKSVMVMAVLTVGIGTARAQGFETGRDHKGGKMYTGFVTDSLLQSDTAFAWFAEAQRIYKPQPPVVETIAGQKDSISFLVFMGTWCEDSHFVIPRFFKTLDAAGYARNRITLYALDTQKKDRAHLAAALGVTNVPTIIVYKAGRELGRVIEYGKTGRFDEEVAGIIRSAR